MGTLSNCTVAVNGVISSSQWQKNSNSYFAWSQSKQNFCLSQSLNCTQQTTTVLVYVLPNFPENFVKIGGDLYPVKISLPSHIRKSIHQNFVIYRISLLVTCPTT